MEFIETEIKGVFVVRLQQVRDQRGYFARAWCPDEFAAHGLNGNMIQMNAAKTLSRGTVRGMHFQLPPHAEAKLMRCTTGAIHDVAVDLRPGSPTLGRSIGVTLAGGDATMLYVPEGFAHGYQALMDDSEIYYLTTARYAPGAARGLRHDDSRLGIQWPIPVTLVSDADRSWPDYRPDLWANGGDLEGRQ